MESSFFVKDKTSFQGKKQNVKQNLYILLSYLGFSNYEKEVKFHKNMFDLPNKCAVQAVFHFLFSKLDKVKAKTVFRDCYPSLDRKQDVAFRRACQLWLLEISKKRTLTEMPPNIQSILLSPQGRKFYKFIYRIALIVLLKDVSSVAAAASENILLLPFRGIKNKISSYSFKYKEFQHDQNFLHHVAEMSKYLQLMTENSRKLQKAYYHLKREARDINSQLKDALISVPMSTFDNILLNRPSLEYELKIEESEANLSNLLQLWNSFDEMLKKEDELFVSCQVPSSERKQFVLNGDNFRNSLSETSINILKSNGIDINKFKLEKDGKLDFAAGICLVNCSLELLIKQYSYFAKMKDSIKQIPKSSFEEYQRLLNYVNEQKGLMTIMVCEMKENILKLEEELYLQEVKKSLVSQYKKNEDYILLPPTPPFALTENCKFKDIKNFTFAASPISCASNNSKHRRNFIMTSSPLMTELCLHEKSCSNNLANEQRAKNLTLLKSETLNEISNSNGPTLPSNISSYDVLMEKLLNKRKSRRRVSSTHSSFKVDPISGLSLLSKGDNSVFCDDESGLGTQELEIEDIPETTGWQASPPKKKTEFSPNIQKSTIDINDIIARYKNLKSSQDKPSEDIDIKNNASDRIDKKANIYKKRRSIRLDKTLLEPFDEQDENSN